MATNDAPLNVAASRGLSLALEQAPQAQGLIFSDNFDAQADWQGDNGGSAWADEGATVPTGWDAYRTTGGWSPSTGYPSGKEAAYVTGETDKVRGGTGKAFVAYRFGRESSAYWGDSILAKNLPNNQEMFARFWLKFQPGWIENGSTKIFRINAWSNSVKDDYWSSPAIQPGFLWGFSANSFGSRNKISLRNTPYGTVWNDPPIPDLPASMSSGDLSLSWSFDAFDLDGDGINDNSPEIPDLINGGFIGPTDTVNHGNIFGTEWRKIEFYVKMNSAPGVADGIAKMWFMDQLVFSNTQIAWIQNGGDPNSTWDVVKIGGNDSHDAYADESPILDADQVTEWYAIDDLEVYDSLPEGKV